MHIQIHASSFFNTAIFPLPFFIPFIYAQIMCRDSQQIIDLLTKRCQVPPEGAQFTNPNGDDEETIHYTPSPGSAHENLSFAMKKRLMASAAPPQRSEGPNSARFNLVSGYDSAKRLKSGTSGCSVNRHNT